MKLIRKLHLLVLLAVCHPALAVEEPCSPDKEQLQFKISQEPVKWNINWDRMDINRPTHLAYVHLKNAKYWDSPFARVRAIDYPRRGGGPYDYGYTIYEAKFKYEGAKAKPGELKFICLVHHKPETTGQMWLLAGSEHEARKLAEVFINEIKDSAFTELRRKESDLEKYRGKIERLEKEIPKRKQDENALRTKLKELKKKTYYRSADDAQNSILQWNNLLNMIEVDIAGIKARLSKIREIRIDKGRTTPTVDEMEVTAEVDLAEALAKKNAAKSHREKALNFLELAEKAENLSRQLSDKQKALSIYSEKVNRLEEKLLELKESTKPVEVVNNEVVIYPVPEVLVKLK